MKKTLITILLLNFCFFSAFSVKAEYEQERQDIYDYKEFFDELYPVEETNDDCSITPIGTIYNECTGVTVNGTTYSLEDYVAGVLAAEFSFTMTNDEIGKADAIATRSYTLAHTNNCKNSIGSSSYEQNFSTDIEKYKKFSYDTAGIVMVDPDGEIILGVYSLAPADDCILVDGKCKFQRCTRYAESISSCPGKVTEFIVPQGTVTYPNHDVHYGGIEPYIARYLGESENYTYDKLLKAFYGDDLTLARLTSSGSANSSNTSNTSTNSTSTNSTDLICESGNNDYAEVDGITFPVKNYDIEGTSDGLSDYFDLSAGNVSQCPWYAKYRAIEIIMTSTLSDDLKEKAKSVLLSTAGNGNQWYGGSNSTLSYFEYTNDINKAKPGSIVSWERNTHSYGHVAIVEKVNSDGSLVISEGWNMGGPDAADIPSNIRVITHTMTLDEVQTYNGGGTFIGYTYLFSYKK